jgi:hypothetical protein
LIKTRSTSRKSMMRHSVSTLILSAAALGFTCTADAQVQLRSAPDPRIQTLGESRQDNAAAEESFRNFMGETHPLWRRLTWAQALPNLEVLAISGFPAGTEGVSRVAPEFVATEVSLSFPFKNSELTARRAYLLDDHIILRDMTLDNDSGRMEAEFAVLSKDALRIIGEYLQDQRPDPAEPALAGSVLFNHVIAASHEFAGDRPGRGFASSVAADRLGFSGISWGEGEDAWLLFSGLTGAGLTGSARFGGTAEFSLAAIDFSGSIPDIRAALMERLGRGAAEEPVAVDSVAPPGVPPGGGEQLAQPDREAGGETADGQVAEGETPPALPATPPAPVRHPFNLAFSDLSYSATRGSEAPATIAARGGALRGSIEENGAMQVTARLADMRASASIFTGTPLEEATQQIAERAGEPHLKLDLALDAALSSDRLRLNLPCATLPGLIDVSTDIDVTISGLERMLTAPRGGRSNGAMDLLFASQARVLAIRLVDNGLNAALTASGLAPLGEMIQSTLLSRLEGQEGMRMMMLQTALAPVTSILGQYDEQGSVALEARFREGTNLPVALVSFLQSAQTVANAAPDPSLCEAVPLVQ